MHSPISKGDLGLEASADVLSLSVLSEEDLVMTAEEIQGFRDNPARNPLWFTEHKLSMFIGSIDPKDCRATTGGFALRGCLIDYNDGTPTAQLAEVEITQRNSFLQAFRTRVLNKPELLDVKLTYQEETSFKI